MKKELTNTKTNIESAIDTILGGVYDVGSNSPEYEKALSIKTEDKTTVKIENPITGKKAIVVIDRKGTTEDKLAAIMLAPDATKEQQLSMVASYMFERGKENGSFMAELFLSKGTLTKETQIFKKQMRWDFEAFSSTVSRLFTDMGNGITKQLANKEKPYEILAGIANRLTAGAELIEHQRSEITDKRMRDQGFGIYIGKDGRSYSIFDKEIVDVVTKDKEDYENKSETI